MAVYRPSTSTFIVKDQFTVTYGVSGDVPIPADYDGDGDTDIAVFRPSTGVWIVKDQGSIEFGVSGDKLAACRGT